MDGHLYFPNILWDAVRIEAIWDDDIQYLKCGEEEDKCNITQDMNTHVPDYLFAEIEQQVMRDFAMMLQITPDSSPDNQNMIRS